MPMQEVIYDDGAGQYAPPMYQQGNMSYQGGQNHPDIVRFQLECERIIEDVEHFLNGDKWLVNEKQWHLKFFQPICSERMRYTLLETLRTHLDKNITLSNFEVEEIYATMLKLNVELILLIGLNHEEFYYPFTYMDIVIQKLINPIFANFKRAEGAGERNAIKMIEKVQNTIMERPMDKPNLFQRATGKITGNI
jgi:hypothetical protein